MHGHEKVLQNNDCSSRWTPVALKMEHRKQRGHEVTSFTRVKKLGRKSVSAEGYIRRYQGEPKATGPRVRRVAAAADCIENDTTRHSSSGMTGMAVVAIGTAAECLAPAARGSESTEGTLGLACRPPLCLFVSFPHNLII